MGALKIATPNLQRFIIFTRRYYVSGNLNTFFDTFFSSKQFFPCNAEFFEQLVPVLQKKFPSHIKSAYSTLLEHFEKLREPFRSMAFDFPKFVSSCRKL